MPPPPAFVTMTTLKCAPKAEVVTDIDVPSTPMDSGKPSNVMEKILDGKMKKFYSEVTLLNQSFVIDTDKTIKEAISDFNLSNSFILKNYVLISL